MRTLLVAGDVSASAELTCLLRARGHDVTVCTPTTYAACEASYPLIVISVPPAEAASVCRTLCRLQGDDREVVVLADISDNETVAALLDAGAGDVMSATADAAAFSGRLVLAEQRLQLRSRHGGGEVHRERAEAEALLEATATLGVQADPEDVVRALVEQAVKLLDAEGGSYTISRDGISITSTIFHGGDWLADEYEVPLQGSIAGLVWRTGRPYRTNDLANDPHTLRSADSRYGLRSQIVVPLLGPGNDKLGLLALGNSRRAAGFSEHDERLLVAFCEYASLVLVRAHDTAARVAAEAETARRRREVEALLEAADQLNRAAEPAEVLTGVVEVAVRLLGATGAALVTNEGDHGFMRHSWRDGVWRALDVPVPLDGSVSGLVIRSGHPFRSGDAGADPAVYRLPTGTVPPRGCLLAVPIIGRAGVLGVLHLMDAHDGRQFSDDDLRLAEGIARHAASALERAFLTAELRGKEERLQHIIETTPDLICVVDLTGRFTFVNSAFRSALGRDPGALLGRSAGELIHRDDLPDVLTAFQHHLQAADESLLAGVSVRIAHADGRWLAFEAKGRLLHDANGEATGVLIIGRDITARRALQEQLARQAFHDPLTGLPNRALFMDRLEHALARIERAGRTVAVMFLDLDRFKAVNDSRGHAVGDQLLVAVGARLAECLRPGDTVARFGGDEFIVLLEDILQSTDAAQVAGRILEAIRQPFLIDGHELFTATSIGIACCTDMRMEPVDLLREADIALYQAKAAGRGSFCMYESSMRARAVERLDRETDLRRALERGELRVYYQPEIDLATNVVVGVEALLRWQHPRLGMLTPAEIIPMAEETGLIVPIGRWVLEEACRQGAAWQALRPTATPLVINVNLSARQLQQPDLAEVVSQVLGQTGLDPNALRLEITETTAMQDAEATTTTLHALRGLGVSLAIDDFGTGYSSLSYLRRFPIDTLKIDRSFLLEVEHDESAVAIVRAVTALAAALGIDVTAEGIETAGQLARVADLGCDRGQGFYFARPLPPDVFEALLRDGAQMLGRGLPPVA